MAVGFWQKLKNFGKKVWGGIKKVAAPVMKVVKPIVSQFKSVIPGGEIISKGLDFVDDNIVKPHMGPGDAKVDSFLKKINPVIQYGTHELSRRVNLRK